jgi:hypothetical protein
MPDAILNDLFSQTQNPVIDVDHVLGQILGVQLDGDAGRFRSALARAFPSVVNAAGATSIRYVAPSYAVQSLQSGTIPATGALAGIQAQTTLLAGEALTLLARLRPLHCACDAGVESSRDLIRGALEALPGLFAEDAGPSVRRVDQTFQLLTGVRFGHQASRRTADPEYVGGEVGVLRDRLGIRDEALTIDDEEIRTDFRIFVSYVWMLETAWAAVRDDFDCTGPDSLGVNVRRIHRRLLAVLYANADFYAALDEARVGPAERATFTLDCKPPITLADLLSWIDEIASPRGLAVIATGQDGIRTIAPVVDELLDLICNHLKRLIDGAEPKRHVKGVHRDCGDATFLSTHRTKAAVNKLALQLTELAHETTRALPTQDGESRDARAATATHEKK